jgi:hypothetical protein
VLALRTTEPAISDVYFTVRTSLTEEQEKALVLRLNSFWGILTVFSFMRQPRRHSRGQIRRSGGYYLILNVREFNEGAVKCLANAFDEYAHVDFGGLP